MEIQWNYTVYVCANCANQPKMFLLFAASKIGHVKPQKHGGIFFHQLTNKHGEFRGGYSYRLVSSNMAEKSPSHRGLQLQKETTYCWSRKPWSWLHPHDIAIKWFVNPQYIPILPIAYCEINHDGDKLNQ